jgi:AraC-like DNA-binding protein
MSEPTSFRPAAALRSRVASIHVVEQEGATTVLPSTGAVLGFQFRGRVRAGSELLSAAGVTGLQRSARQYSYGGGAASVLVRFTPVGAACLGVPAFELTDRSVPLEDLLPAELVRETCDRVVAAQTARERVAAIETLLLGLPFAGDPLVARAIDGLAPTSGDDARISALARSLGVSERQLERRFLGAVGITPKRFAVLRRFEHAVTLLEKSETAASLANVAVDAGYYDQSHFIRDFRRAAGGPPGRFLRGSR